MSHRVFNLKPPLPRASLQARIVVMLSGTLLITLLIIAVSVYLLVAQAEKDAWRGIQSVAARTAALNIKTTIENFQADVRFAANAGAGENAPNELLYNILDANPEIFQIARVDLQGNVQSAIRRNMLAIEPSAIGSELWFTEAPAAGTGRFYISELRVLPDNTPYLTLSTRGDDEAVGVASVSMAVINRVLAQIDLGQTDTAYLVQGDGQIIAHTDPQVMRDAPSLAGRPEMPASNQDTLVESREYTNFRDVAVLGVSKVIDGTDWVIFIEVSQREIFDAGHGRIIPLGAFVMLFWGGAVATTLWLIRTRLFMPLERLRAGQEAVASGSLDNYLDVTVSDEIGAVTDGFNAMVAELKERTAERENTQHALQESEKRYRELIENVSDIVYTVDPKGFFTYVSPSVTQLTGYTEQQIVGMHFTTLVVPEWRQMLIDFYRGQAQKAEPETVVAFPIITAGGARRWVEQKTSLLINFNRQVTGFQSVVRDITERKEAEEQLLYNQRQMRQVADSLNGAIYQFVADGEQWRIEYISDGIEKLIGVSASTIVESFLNLVDAVHPDDVESFVLSLNDAVREKRDYWVYEGRFIHQQDETLRWFRAEARLDDNPGERVVMKGVMLDISERVRFEESLRLTGKAVESSPVGIVIADALQPDTPLIYVNPTFETMTGYSADEVIGRNCRFLQGDDKDQPALNVLRAAVSQQRECVVILRNYRKDGSLFWNELSISPIFDQHGEVTHFLGIQNNITERIEAEITLKQQDEVLQAVTASTSLLLREADWRGSIDSVLESLGHGVGASRTFLFRRSPTEDAAQLVVDLTHEWTLEGVTADIDNPVFQQLPLSDIAPRWATLMQQNQVIEGYTQNFAPEERALLNEDVVYLLIIPIFVDGVLWGAVGFDDCTGTHEWTSIKIDLLRTVADNLGAAVERQLAERQIQSQNESLVKTNRELAVARKQAEAANKLKSQFLATMSHELRTPLNAVIGYAQLQLAGMVGDMSEEQLGFQERILANAQHLLQLINEVLDLSKIEAGRMELVDKPFDLRECLHEIIMQNHVLAKDKGLDFTLNVDERLPEIIVGDRGRIKQIIINLVSNAIKFTDEGSVIVEAVLYNKDNWRITVTDSGCGIAPHLQETIFDEFRQAESGIDRGGTGLGLAIVRKLVLMMGGNIRLTSEVGKGSAFTITLPLLIESALQSEEILQA